jgi:hypothetical protein
MSGVEFLLTEDKTGCDSSSIFKERSESILNFAETSVRDSFISQSDCRLYS